jgi:hypothetical protein
MSENGYDASERYKRAKIKDSLLDILWDTLKDPDEDIRTSALRLLVRLPLPDQAWYRLAHDMTGQLNLYLTPDPGHPPSFAFDELLEASLYVPVSTLRHTLYEFLAEGRDQAARQQVVWSLAKARDRVAVDFLWPALEGAGEFNPQQAAFWLAHYDLYEQSEELNKLAKTHADAVVRFWLSVAALRLGDDQPVADLFAQILEGKLELPLLWGNPLDLADQVAACGPFLGDFDQLLLLIHYQDQEGQGDTLPKFEELGKLLRKKSARLDELAPLVEALVDRVVPQPSPPGWSAEPPAQPVSPWEGDITRLVDQLLESGGAEHEALGLLTPGQRTSLISAWFSALEKRTAADDKTGEHPRYPGIGNPIVQLPNWFWQGFDPDLPQLFDTYLQLYPERRDLMEQLACVISRAGIERLMEEYTPLLPLLENHEKTVLLHLLERSTFYARQEYGPLFGAGPSAAETTPVIRHFIDMKSTEMAPDETPMTLEGEESAPRYVQGEVYDNSDSQALQRLERAFLAGKPHLLKVWIGELQTGAIAAPGPIDLGALPDLPGWDMQVYFWEPNHAPEMQIGNLTIHQEQLPDLPISTCEFTFTPRPELPNFQGRLAVVYQKNVLQMLFLEGKVLADPATAGEQDRIRFEWAQVKGLGNPDQLSDFDLTFYNEVDPVAGTGLAFFGGQAGLKQVSGLDQGIKDLIAALKEAGAPGTASLEARKDSLILLANLGSLLYSAMVEQLGVDDQAAVRLHDVQRLQLVSAVRDVFPLELVYVYPPPDPDAELCPNAQQAILDGFCATCEGLDGAKATRVVCPLGFLGLRSVIERHAIQPVQQTGAALQGSDYLLRVGLSAGGKTISPLKSSLCATSARVTSPNKKKLATALKDLFPNSFNFVNTWTDWKSKVKDQTILILIPHTLKDRGIPSLEIGDSKLWKTGINASVVPATPQSRPLVLLMGCETAVPDVPYQGFAAAFSAAGAAITVMTISPIHESHAIPITEILVKQFGDSALMQQTFSEALLQARRTAMAAGYAEALTLVADGDADWILV